MAGVGRGVVNATGIDPLKISALVVKNTTS
jgi:hypothetical protein